MYEILSSSSTVYRTEYRTYLLQKDCKNFAVITQHNELNGNKISFYREYDNFNDAKEMFLRLI